MRPTTSPGRSSILAESIMARLQSGEAGTGGNTASLLGGAPRRGSGGGTKEACSYTCTALAGSQRGFTPSTLVIPRGRSEEEGGQGGGACGLETTRPLNVCPQPVFGDWKCYHCNEEGALQPPNSTAAQHAAGRAML